MPAIAGLKDAALMRHRAAPNRAAALHEKLESDLQHPRIFGQPERLA
jgi:hypothetical protein